MAAANTSIDLTVRVYFAGGTVTSSAVGTYTGAFTFNLYTGYTSVNANAVYQASGTLFIAANAVTSGTRGVMSLSPTTLNFGAMQDGISYSQTAYLNASGVNNTKIYLSSANLGKLKLSDGSSEIAYTVVVDSVPPGSSPVTITSFPYANPLVSFTGITNDRAYTVVVTTEVLPFLEAGDYTDTLTFTFTVP
jgi:hypothetical protein